jgi:hypothetical protein
MKFIVGVGADARETCVARRNLREGREEGRGTLKTGFIGTGMEGIDVNVFKAVDIQFRLKTCRGTDQSCFSGVIANTERMCRCS